MDNIVNDILEKLNLKPEHIVKSKRSNSDEIIAIDLINSLVQSKSILEASKMLECGEQTLNRVITKVLVPTLGRVNGGNETWRYALLRSVSLKECNSCSNIKSYSKFHIDNYNSGLRSECSDCRSAKYGKGQYTRYKEQHIKSYAKNWHKILNRNTVGKYKRSLRKVKWADSLAIDEFYKNCPEGHHVDHIIPLLGKAVSGLHVLSNLQYLTKAENLSKGNKYIQE